MSKKRQKLLLTLWIIALCLCLIASYLTFINCGYTKVCFLDVGQGDSCYIKTEKGSTILIDGGDDGSGKYVLSPFLRTEFVKELDAVFLSHLHNDHIIGIIELLEADFPIEKIYLSDKSLESDDYDRLSAIANYGGTEIELLSDDAKIYIDNIEFSVISSGYSKSDDENDNSLILRMDCGENSILFTGDATRKYENQLLEDADLDVDFLKVAHHGSYTSSGTEFISAVSPELSIISVGKDNRYNHPSKQTLNTMREMDIPVMRTDFDGTITIIMTDNDIKNISGSRERRNTNES